MHEFVLVDAATLARKPAFDHERLAAALSKATGQSYTSHKLPFAMVEFRDKGQAIEVPAADFFGNAASAITPAEDRSGAVAIPAAHQSAARHARAEAGAAVSPDGKWEAVILNFNVYVRPKGKQEGVP